MLNYIKSESTNPYFNLALEQYVFDNLSESADYLMLWQNDNTIVVGKYQNTYAEINQSFVNEKNINVVRRLSGGGAVYHDLGNLNYTFITKADASGEIDFRAFCKPVVNLLCGKGVSAKIDGRNDMTVDGKKFSGNAQYIKNGRVMHHGTILFKSDLTVLSGALKVSEDKIVSKGIKSVRSRVCNLTEYLPENYTLHEFEDDLIKEIADGTETKKRTLTEEDIKAVEKLQRDVYEKWEWNYGYSPECEICRTRRVEGVGKIETFIDLNNGCIKEIEFRGDYFSLKEMAELEKKLIGCKLERDAVIGRLADINISDYFQKISIDDFVNALL